MLKIHPNLPALQLRPLLNNSLPHIQSIDSKFINNFRMKVALFHARNPAATELTLSEGMNLTKNVRVSVADAKILEDPLVRLNFQAMYENILHGEHETWKCLAYLDKLKEEMKGFDHRIHYNSSGLPNAIMFMTPEH